MSQRPAIYFNIKSAKVADLISAALKPFADQLRDKEIDLQQKLDEKNLAVNIDYEKTVWVLINLIGNALRYTNRWGRLIISAQKEQDTAENKSYVRIVVSDTGRGIEESILRRLFLPFTSNEGGEQGLGIGLFISEEIIRAEGGKISAESKLGEGSKFSLLLPC